MKVLLTGISGKAGRLVATRLLDRGHTVVGIDRHAWPDAPDGIEVHRLDIRKRGAEEVFRSGHLDAVIHMATVTHLTHRSEDRYRINLEGTRAVFEHAHDYDIRQVIFVGRHTFYGASAESPLYPSEDAPPQSVNSFPELSDLVAADLYAGSALWRHPEIRTTILRLPYILGPSCHGTLADFLKRKRVPTILGFDPLFQFLHDQDMADAVVLAFESNLNGVYNVAGPMPIPLSVLIRETGRQQVPVPELLFRMAQGRLGMPRLPRGALAHMKYPVVVNSDAFHEATGFEHQFEHQAILSQFKESCPPN